MPLRWIVHLFQAFLTVSLVSTWAQADPIAYSITDLGSVAGGNYLNNLSASDKALFQTGSFDQWAHPSLVGDRGLGNFNEGNPTPGSSRGWWGNSIAVSSNDLGISVGTADHIGTPGAFVHDPHFPPSSWQESPPGVGFLFVMWRAGSHASAINNQGFAVGSAVPMSGWSLYEQPVLFGDDPKGPTFLDPLFRPGIALALNNDAQIVGSIQMRSGPNHAFVYDHGIFQDLNDIIPTSSGILLERAVGIDAQGRIVAFSDFGQSGPRAYLLTPTTVPEPGTLVFASLIIVATAIRRLRKSDS